MSLATFLLYLLGSEAAIRQMAENPWTIGVGLIFVLTAGIARSYRKHDLRSRPGYLLLPLAASVGTSMILFLMISAAMVLGGATLLHAQATESTSAFVVWMKGYASFLGLFWMTAPLAWFYGIPFERWTTRLKAVKTRLWCLGLVSLWRMVLMMRVLVVLLDCPTSAAVFTVMLFGDLVAVTALWVTQLLSLREADVTPYLLTGMGGIGPTAPAEVDLLSGVHGWVLGVGILTGPVWLIGAFNAWGASDAWATLPHVSFAASSPTAGLTAFTAGSLVAWSLFLIPAQRRQRLRVRIETLAEKEPYDSALGEMSAHEASDFPPHWFPPPSGDFRTESSQQILLGMIERLTKSKPTAWVRESYLDQFGNYLDEAMWYWFDDEKFLRVAELLRELPEGPELAGRAAKAIDQLLQKAARFSFPMFEEHEGEPTLPPFAISEELAGQDVLSDPKWPRETPERREALKAIRGLTGRGPERETSRDHTSQE